MYSFLKSITLIDTGRQRLPKEKSPTGLTIRVLTTGEVYPSQELVDKFDLEYKPIDPADRENAVMLGNGFDIVDSKEWTPLKDYPRMILVGVTPKKEAKVDLFARCLHNPNNGLPKATVITQGSVNTELVDLCRSMGYLTETQKYVDLRVVIDYPINPEGGIAYLPKKIEKGPKKGEPTYERRENVVLYPLNTPENLEKLAEEEKKSEERSSTGTLTVSENSSVKAENDSAPF